MTETVPDIERAREALRHEAWSEAYEILRAADPSSLGGREFEGFSEAAWWRCDLAQALSARQRAYSAYVAEGDEARALYTATRLCVDHFNRGEASVAAGWLQRARSHGEGVAECVELGYLATLEGLVALEMGDPRRAIESLRHGGELARRFGDADLLALTTMHQGQCAIAAGDVERGLALFDRAMTAVIAGELSGYFTGAVYCAVIASCLEVTDVRRAGEWSEAARGWCDSIPADSPYPGQCRVARAEVARLRGAWAEAEAEAMRATEEVSRIDPRLAASAFAKVGDVRARRGDLAEAEAMYARARELGFDPQPGLALVRLAQGKPEAARSALQLAIADGSHRPARTATLLAAMSDVALATGDLEGATEAAEELGRLAETIGTRALDAMADAARGSVALARGEAPAALPYLRRACAAWQELGLPYETARMRGRFGLALRQAGNEDDALLELRAALAAFERLGAALDASEVAVALGELGGLPGGLTSREAEVLRLVATGKTNRDIAVELVISEHTVARHLQKIYAKVGVSTRTAATAFAFEHGLT